jgi:hypothetical protein
MKRVTSIFLSIFILSVSAFAKDQILTINVDKSRVEQGYITEKIWLENYAIPKVEATNARFVKVNAFPKGAEPASITDLRVIIGKERKRPFAFVSIPVYSLNSNSEKQQLESFTLNITESKENQAQSAVLKTTNSNSVLSAGNWYKISVTDRGIYKIDYNFIKDKLGVDPSTINPANIRVYGNGGAIMSESNAVLNPDDLVENAIKVVDGSDNAFNQGDYVLFFANGPTGWVADEANHTFHHIKNIYEDKSYYFINFDKGQGSRISSQAALPPSSTIVTQYDDYLYHDIDLHNAGRFGKKWWGEDFSSDPSKATKSFSFTTNNLVDSALLSFEFGNVSTNSANLSVLLNSQSAGTYLLSPSGAGDDYAISPINKSIKLPVSGTSLSLQFSYAPAASTARGYLNYFELASRQQLSFKDGQMIFCDWQSIASGAKATYQLQNASGNVNIWDITDPLHPVLMPGSLSGSAYSFTQDASTLHQFIAFDGSAYNAPQFVSKIDNQDLHGTAQVDLIVVTNPKFLSAAKKLGDFHRDHDNMRVVVVTTDQVYNEFSSGSQDIGAIRDFARMFYKRAGLDTTEMPKHLLLFGDASYDYKERINGNTNFVPTYETSNSEQVIYGYCSDDYFGFLDDNEEIENWNVANTLDLSVGRLPVGTESGADEVVEKIINYAGPASLGPWRLSTTIMSDDGDGNIHYDDGEIMAATINGNSNIYNQTKVYVSAIEKLSTPGGERAPDANKLINDQVFKGTFLMNYNGHGSPTTMAHERILTQDDFNNWRNANKLPIMVTATCDFSKYDDPSSASAGELLTVKPDGGAIVLLTTTQLVYQYLNRPMNVDFLNSFFKQSNGSWPTFGDAFRRSKNATYSGAPKDAWTLSNFRKFALLGDPALTPAFPKYKVVTDSAMNGNSMTAIDTMSALGKYKIYGSVRDGNGNTLTDFNGRIYVTIFDKPKTVSVLTGPARNFSVQNSIIYKGKATVTNGVFSFMFIAPKDINYEFGKGKISYYAENGVTDAAGADTNFSIGGFADDFVPDDASPIVKPFMNDSMFIDGGITGPNSVLYVQLSDNSGINVTGNSIGHDLTAVLDDDVQHPYILNDYYETAPNDYMRGFVYFPISGLSEGEHTITVKAWDMFNNSGEGTVRFRVISGSALSITNLTNYPNPFSTLTHFVFEHNHPEEKLDAEINIYSSSGYLVRTLKQSFTPEGSRTNELIWDGTGTNGPKLPDGVYVYRLTLRTPKGIQASAYQKLVLIR